MTLNDEQYKFLCSSIDKRFVSQRSQSGRSLSYLEAWHVKRTLIRVFGFGGFSATADEAECVSHQEGQGKDGKNHVVCWKVRVTLSIPSLDATYSEYAVGSANLPSLADAHDMAIKTAESDALKRAAINLGTQFGLSLYNDGSLLDVVGRTLDGQPTVVRASAGEGGESAGGVLDLQGSLGEGVRAGELAGQAPSGAPGGVRGAGGSDPRGADAGSPVLPEGVREPGAHGASDSRGELAQGGGSTGADADVSFRSPEGGGEPVPVALGGTVLPGVRQGGEREAVRAPEGGESVKVKPVLSERAEEFLAALRSLHGAADADRIAGVATLKAVYGDVLDEITRLKDGHEMTLGRLADIVATGA